MRKPEKQSIRQNLPNHVFSRSRNTTRRDPKYFNWFLLGTSSLTIDLYESKVINGHHRCPNLGDDMVRAKVPDFDVDDTDQ